jgi:hypothetical protein
MAGGWCWEATSTCAESLLDAPPRGFSIAVVTAPPYSCATCATPLPAHAQFCPRCGTRRFVAHVSSNCRGNQRLAGTAREAEPRSSTEDAAGLLLPYLHDR